MISPFGEWFHPINVAVNVVNITRAMHWHKIIT